MSTLEKKADIVEEVKKTFSYGFKPKMYASLRLKLSPILEVEKHVAKEGKILDLGCGVGIFALILHLGCEHRQIFGIDQMEERVETARRISQGTPQLEFATGDASKAGVNGFNIVTLIDASRNPDKYDEELATWIDFGSSPRGSIALDKCSRVVAWMNERDYVTPDDVKAIAHDVLRHRILLSFEATAEGVKTEDAIDRLLQNVAIS